MGEKILCILLLNVWIFQHFFPYLSYEWSRNECWENFVESKNDIPPEAIQTISFPLDALIHWEKKDKEFVWKGKMYDVISMQKNDSAIVINCVSDSEEDALIYAFRKAAKNTQKNKLKIRVKKNNLFAGKQLQFSFSRHIEQNTIDTYKITLLTIFPRVPSPPPKLLC